MGEQAASAEWERLPAAVRAAVEAHVGPIAGADPIATSAADFAAVLRPASGGRVFVKAVAGIDRRMRWLRNETTNPATTVGLAPAVLFHTDLDAATAGHDWLVVGFAHIPGRPADLAPDSPDLPLIATTLERIAALPAGPAGPLRRRWAPTDWWQRLAHLAPETIAGFDVAAMTRLCQTVPDLVDGDHLTHTDLHGDQFILGPDHTVHVIDWGFPAAAAPWIDTAFLTLRLIEAGHTHDNATGWARAQPTLTGIDDHTLTAWTAYVAGFWTHLAATGGPGSLHRARLAREHLRWRLTQRPTPALT